MNRSVRVTVILLAAAVVAGGLWLGTHRPAVSRSTQASKPVGLAPSVPAPPQPQHPPPPVHSTNALNSTLALLIQDISRAGNLGKARQTVARDLKAAVAAGRITVFDLQAAILDPTIPVEARIIAAEAIMGLLPDQVSALDVVALSQILIGAESPLLSTRLIELLGMTRNPACLAAIQTKAAVPAENIRLAAVAAAVGFNDPLASRFLEKCAQDAEFYRVRIQAIHAIAHDPNQTNAIAVIRNALEVERSRTPASTPAGQSPDLNRQLLTVAAARAMSGKSDPATVSFLSEQLGDPETPLPARKAAADALGETRNPTGVGPLLTALDDTDEGLRMHAARALKNGFGAAYDENIRRSLSHCRDPYAVQQITQILESKR